MKTTATPVFRPTADCIWNSFRSSGKRHIRLTGGRDEERMALLKNFAPHAVEEACKDAFGVDLDAPYGSTACVIMASGLGRRFGSNKLMADFDGEPLICRTLSATEGIFSQHVVVTRHEDVTALCRERNIDVLLHNLPHRSDTIRLGLDALEKVDGCMFCAADQPLLRRETVAALSLAAVNDPLNIHRTSYENIPGNPVWFPTWAFDSLRSLPEGKGGGFIANLYRDRVRLLTVKDKFELMDGDTPEDLELLRRHFSALNQK